VRKERKMKGFTLVELLIVLLILGILIGLAVPRYLQALEKSKQTTFCSNVRNVISAMESWRMENATTAYPDFDTLNATIIKSATYFSQPPQNPYTNEILQAVSSTDAAMDNYFYYSRPATGSYKIETKPECGLQ